MGGLPWLPVMRGSDPRMKWWGNVAGLRRAEEDKMSGDKMEFTFNV